MIKLQRLNSQELWVNPELVEQIEAHPDTIIMLTNGNRLTVKNPVSEVVDKIIQYRQKVYQQHLEKQQELKT